MKGYEGLEKLMMYSVWIHRIQIHLLQKGTCETKKVILLLQSI